MGRRGLLTLLEQQGSHFHACHNANRFVKIKPVLFFFCFLQGKYFTWHSLFVAPSTCAKCNKFWEGKKSEIFWGKENLIFGLASRRWRIKKERKRFMIWEEKSLKGEGLWGQKEKERLWRYKKRKEKKGNHHTQAGISHFCHLFLSLLLHSAKLDVVVCKWRFSSFFARFSFCLFSKFRWKRKGRRTYEYGFQSWMQMECLIARFLSLVLATKRATLPLWKATKMRERERRERERERERERLMRLYARRP